MIKSGSLRNSIKELEYKSFIVFNIDLYRTVCEIRMTYKTVATEITLAYARLIRR